MAGKRPWWQWAIVIGVVGFVLYIVLGPLSRLVGSFSDLFGSVVGGVNKAVKTVAGGANTVLAKVVDGLGQNPDENDAVMAAVTPVVSNPWSPQFYQQDIVPAGAHYPLSGDLENWREGVHDAVGFWSGYDSSKMEGLFQSIPTKVQFSIFCEYWVNQEGTALAQWLYNGYVGGLVSSVGTNDLAALDAIVQNKPAW